MRKKFLISGISINEISGKTQPLMCHHDNNGKVHVETPDKKTKDYYKLIGVSVLFMVRIDRFKNEMLGIIKM